MNHLKSQFERHKVIILFDDKEFWINYIKINQFLNKLNNIRFILHVLSIFVNVVFIDEILQYDDSHVVF